MIPDLYILLENKRVIHSFHYEEHTKFNIPFTKLLKELKNPYPHKVIWEFAFICLFAFNVKWCQHISIKLYVNRHQDCKKRLTIETQKGQWTSRPEDSSRTHRADSGWPFPDLSASQTRTYGESGHLIYTQMYSSLCASFRSHDTTNTIKRSLMGCTGSLQNINKPTNVLNIDVVWMNYMVTRYHRIDNTLTVTTGS